MAAKKKATAKSHGRERPARAEELSAHGITDDERLALGLAAKKAGKSVSRFVQEMVAEKKALPKKRMGPPTRAGVVASSFIGIRVTEDEREALELAAKKAGKSISEFIRDKLFNGTC